MANRKYEILMDEANTITFAGRVLHRVRSLQVIRNSNHTVPVGELGGYVESEKNLSDHCECWISGDAKVMDDAVVTGGGYVTGEAVVEGDAKVTGRSSVGGNSRVMDKAMVFDSAVITGNALVAGRAMVYDNAFVVEDAKVLEDAHIFGNAYICGHARIKGEVHIRGDAFVGGNAQVMCKSELPINAWLDGRAFVANERHCFTVSKFDKWGNDITFYHIFASRHIGVYAESETFEDLPSFRRYCRERGGRFEEQGNMLADMAEKVIICPFNTVVEKNSQIQEA